MPRRKYTVQADKLRHKRNHPPPDQPWVWFTREMLESEAWSTAPINTRRLVERIILEHMAHAGTENGRLICTYRDFERHGIGKRHIAGAVEDAASRGLIVVTEKGKASSGINRWPSRYALGWLPLHNGAAASNRWKQWSRPAARPPYTGDIEGTIRKWDRRNGRKSIALPHEGGVALPPEGGVALDTKVGQGKNCVGGMPATRKTH